MPSARGGTLAVRICRAAKARTAESTTAGNAHLSEAFRMVACYALADHGVRADADVGTQHAAPRNASRRVDENGGPDGDVLNVRVGAEVGVRGGVLALGGRPVLVKPGHEQAALGLDDALRRLLGLLAAVRVAEGQHGLLLVGRPRYEELLAPNVVRGLADVSPDARERVAEGLAHGDQRREEVALDGDVALGHVVEDGLAEDVDAWRQSRT
ncbi:ABC transporter ATP-binding protein [Babesia caballi]|uniref:ABC transporter ATP-binding protein n=1 Tax=Babesia caballi TaxID=5871 RepID=A0AAV4LTX4_BABCB|nr:ABC transporter ATP-binding protein [Babesia caballi]